MFSSLKVRNFRIYWIGMLVSLIGTWIQQVAQSWLVFQLTNSAFLLGFVGFLNSIPMLLLSLFAGVLADRTQKRKILIVTQILFMILAFLLGVLTQLELITPIQIMVIALLNGAVMAFDAPARQAMVVEMVGKAHLPNAIALNSVSFNSSRIIGPALAGILIAYIGMSGCFYLNGISFLAVIAALVFIRVQSNVVREQSTSPLKDLKEGIAFIMGQRLVFSLIMMVGVASLFGIAYVILMPIFANDILHVGVKGLATLMSASGLGALIGALILARLGDFRNKGAFVVYSAFIFSIALVLFGLSKVFILSLAALVFVGATSVTSVALVNTILQTNVPDRFRGRVMSAFMITFAGVMPFGNLLAGFLAQSFGASVAVMAGGIICTVLFAIINLIYPEIIRI
jgi:MFS family permease